jgi:signal transduction histidine kinase
VDTKVLAHTDPGLINQRQDDPLFTQIKTSREPVRRMVEGSDGSRHYDVVKAIKVNGSDLGYLEIGLSLKSMEAAWRRSLRNMLVFGLALVVVGVLGMGAIFYNQQGHWQRVKSLEGEITRQERLSELGNLAATVAHEIRNPLNSVSMGLQRLKAEFSPSRDQDEYARFLSLMQGEVHRLNSIVEQFLSLARPLSLKREKIAVEKFLNELSTLAVGDANSANVNIDLKIAPGLHPLMPIRIISNNSAQSASMAYRQCPRMLTVADVIRSFAAHGGRPGRGIRTRTRWRNFRALFRDQT